MLKRIFTTALAVLTLFSICIYAEAANQTSPVSVVSAYYFDGYLSAYVNVDSSYAEKAFDTKVLAIVGNQGYRDGLFKQPNNSTSKVTYMLLVDASTSMPYYKDRISSFAQTLLKEENAKTKQLTVATLGDKFKVIAQNLKKPSKVISALEKIEYNQDITDISGCVNDAISYLSNKINKHDEIVNLVVLTDGEPYLDDSGASDEQIKADAGKAKRIIKKTHEVVIHSVGFGEWNKETLEALSSGTGLNLTAYDTSEASEAGKKIADFTDNLYMLSFPVTIGSDTKHFTASFSPDIMNNAIVVSNITNVDARSSSDKTSKAEETKAAVESTNETESSEAETRQNSIETKQPENNKKKTDKKITKPDNNDYTLFIVIGSVAVGLIIAAIIIIMILRKRSSDKDSLSIEMKLEVLEGKPYSSNDRIFLKKEIFVGRKRSCDIAFNDTTLANINTRIYLDNNFIYIEDISGLSNTAVGGMKIYSKNRLRSGDEIRVGNSAFVLRF